MEKKDCLNLISQYFRLESCILMLKNPDFELKSHIFFFKDEFKDIGEVKILRASSKNPADNIIFDIYYVSDEFEGLYHGYFKIIPESEAAEKMFANVSKYCTDLGEYIFYVYQNCELLKIFLVTGNIQSAIMQSENISQNQEFSSLKKKIYNEIAEYSAEVLYNSLLDRRFNSKYIYNFILFNSRCSEMVKMLLISILSKRYSGNICIINSSSNIKHYIYINSSSAYFNEDHRLPIYGLLEHSVNERYVLFLKFDFDYEGGHNSGKAIDKR